MSSHIGIKDNATTLLTVRNYNGTDINIYKKKANMTKPIRLGIHLPDTYQSITPNYRKHYR